MSVDLKSQICKLRSPCVCKSDTTFGPDPYNHFYYNDNDGRINSNKDRERTYYTFKYFTRC